ncbi:hypothetical protein CVT26_007645 [Gymnopilus dilepis]|uniref:F-box domain-containing protein n=1 Tax=Gymnopilus dilepis TaxID=231916 RepID=A0A409VZR3_9AGAR|nr:hypothetical protein CVT26_007645 [Gymnopilus dilepis]
MPQNDHLLLSRLQALAYRPPLFLSHLGASHPRDELTSMKYEGVEEILSRSRDAPLWVGGMITAERKFSDKRQFIIQSVIGANWERIQYFKVSAQFDVRQHDWRRAPIGACEFQSVFERAAPILRSFDFEEMYGRNFAELFAGERMNFFNDNAPHLRYFSAACLPTSSSAPWLGQLRHFGTSVNDVADIMPYLPSMLALESFTAENITFEEVFRRAPPPQLTDLKLERICIEGYFINVCPPLLTGTYFRDGCSVILDMDCNYQIREARGHDYLWSALEGARSSICSSFDRFAKVHRFNVQIVKFELSKTLFFFGCRTHLLDNLGNPIEFRIRIENQCQPFSGRTHEVFRAIVDHCNSTLEPITSLVIDFPAQSYPSDWEGIRTYVSTYISFFSSVKHLTLTEATLHCVLAYSANNVAFPVLETLTMTAFDYPQPQSAEGPLLSVLQFLRDRSLLGTPIKDFIYHESKDLPDMKDLYGIAGLSVRGVAHGM